MYTFAFKCAAMHAHLNAPLATHGHRNLSEYQDCYNYDQDLFLRGVQLVFNALGIMTLIDLPILILHLNIPQYTSI